MKKLLLSFALLASLSTIACGRVDTYRYALSRPTGVVSSSPPAVFLEGQTPQGGMEELAMVEAVGYGNKSDMGNVVRALQDEAARWGANAVVRVRVDCGYSTCHGWGVAVKLAQ
ncbi:MAG: hypothetical protein ACXVEE_29745 [Polyangiales bacterium]